MDELPGCPVCDRRMCLYAQLYCPLEGSPYHRTFHCFCCCSKQCWSESSRWGWCACVGEGGCTSVCVCVCVCACVRVCVRACVRACTFVYSYICMCESICARVHMCGSAYCSIYVCTCIMYSASNSAVGVFCDPKRWTHPTPGPCPPHKKTANTAHHPHLELVLYSLMTELLPWQHLMSICGAMMQMTGERGMFRTQCHTQRSLAC